MKPYSISWTCADCKAQNEKRLDKLQAAFCSALKVARSVSCKKCGSSRTESCSHCGPGPEDPEVLSAWLENKKLYFIEQDEELLLSPLSSAILVNLLLAETTPRWRLGTLHLALLHKTAERDFADAEDAQRAKGYLRERREDWAKARGIPFRVRKSVLAALDEA